MTSALSVGDGRNPECPILELNSKDQQRFPMKTLCVLAPLREMNSRA